MQCPYPFSAIVGQNLLKKALILNAIDPGVGGLLIKGEKGTAKSTAVRALASILPDTVRSDGKSGHMKVVELPLSATEDKVIGSLDLSKAVKEGEKAFEPGLLADADGNILYVDEVNLLNDHVVDVLLDCAATGVNIMEREGMSFTHPSRFILVGTMNPEEGDLRPQFLDRFGLCVDVGGLHDARSRMEILRRRAEFEADPELFRKKWADKDRSLAEHIIRSRTDLERVFVSEEMMRLAVNICMDAHAEGCRGDLVTIRTSKAIVAYCGRTDVTEEDVREAAALALAHRSRDPPSPPSPPPDDEGDSDDEDDGDGNGQDDRDDGNGQSDRESNLASGDSDWEESSRDPDSSGTKDFLTGEEYAIRRSVLESDLRIDDIVRNSSGRRSETESGQGRYTGYRIPHGKPSSIALDATLRAAAIHQRERNGTNALNIEDQDVREKILERKIGNLIVFLVDASGSMGARQRMIAVKGAIASLLTDAYQKRDRVSLITFRADSAEIIVEPTSSVDIARSYMDGIPTGGKTPLIDGLLKADELIRRESRKDPKIRPILVILSDGRGNISKHGKSLSDEIVDVSEIVGDYQKLMIDTEVGLMRLGFAMKLSSAIDAKYVKLDEIRAESLSKVVKSATHRE